MMHSNEPQSNFTQDKYFLIYLNLDNFYYLIQVFGKEKSY